MREFVPNSFLIAQREQAVDFFLANGYLDDSTAQGLQVNINARWLLASSDPSRLIPHRPT